MITVIGQCVEAGNETGSRQLFDVLETLLILVRIVTRATSSFLHLVQEIPLLGGHIPQLAQFLLVCGGNKSYDNEIRVLGLNALNWTVQ
jgi:hypothetical protein